MAMIMEDSGIFLLIHNIWLNRAIGGEVVGIDD